ncbi:DUF550 domain-containing protein [Klebsiella aerogenes]
MTNNQLTKEWLQQTIAELESVRDEIPFGIDTNSELELATFKMALAAMDGEPVAWTEKCEITNMQATGLYLRGFPDNSHGRDIPLYRHAQPAPERDQVRSEHAEWSQATFGNVGPIGPLKHLSKEALEAAAEPDDLSEWADMQFLLWDAQRRAGITDEQITQAMTEKLAVNKQREWPEPKDGEPRLHIKAQPVPVVPDGYVMVPKEPTKEMIDAGWLHFIGTKHPSSKGTYKSMLAAAPQDTPALDSVQSVVTVSDTWIPVSERMPEDEQEVLTVNRMGHRFVSFFDKHSGLFFDRLDAPAACCIEHVLVTHWMPPPAAPQEVKP